MCNICVLFAILVATSFSIGPRSPGASHSSSFLVHAELTDILKLCDHDVDCDHADHDPQPITAPEQEAATYKLLSAGVSQVFWDAVLRRQNGSSPSPSSPLDMVSRECRQQLVAVSSGIASADPGALSFVDASGKAPPGVLRATMTSIGDYDQCLAIRYDEEGGGAVLEGKYCMVDVFAVRRPASTSSTSRKKVDLGRVSVFAGFPHWSAVCVPAACGERELQSLMHAILRPFGARTLGGAVSCDTAADTSWSHRLAAMTAGQVVALASLSAFLAFVIGCSAVDACSRWWWPSKGHVTGTQSRLRSFSVIESGHRLFYSRTPMTYEVLVFELTKVCVIVPGTIGHILMCVELPLSYATMAAHARLNDHFSDIRTQFMLNDNGLMGAALLTGMATFTILHPMAQQRRLPVLAAVVDRFLRFLPAMACLTALEFVWPLLGSGPFHKRVAAFNAAKCSANWWRNLLFANNVFGDGFGAVDICGGHTFWSSVDFQLFVVGVCALWLVVRSRTAGIAFMAALCVGANARIAYHAYVYETTTTLFVPDPVSAKIPQYLGLVHMQTAVYLPAYFAGFAFSHALRHAHLISRLRLDSLSAHACFFLMTQAVFLTINMNAAAVNVFRVVPDYLKPVAILVSRNTQTAAFALMIAQALALQPWYDRWLLGASGGSAPQQPKEAPREPRLNLVRAFTRLTFPLYVSNYLVIRSEFFNRRFLESTDLVWMLKRSAATLVVLYAAAVAFQLLLLSPLDSLKQLLVPAASSKGSSSSSSSQQQVMGDKHAKGG